MTATATLAMVNIDCADPPAMAEFYHRLLGWEIVHSQDDYSMIQGEGAPIGFGKVPAYQPPHWADPSTPKRFHLDTYVEDLEQAEQEAVGFGATRLQEQPQPDRWRVLLDPAGQPFCLCLKS